jgi:hypothetical protein
MDLDEYGEKTGIYKMVDGEFVKISSHPNVAFPVDVFMPKEPYWDENLGEERDDGRGNSNWKPAFIDSKEKKARRLKELGLVEDGGWNPVKRRTYVY